MSSLIKPAEWYTNYDAATSEWKHAIVWEDRTFSFSIFVRNTTKEELDEFLSKNMSDVDSALTDRLKQNFVVTKELVEKKQDDPSHLAKFLPGVNQTVKNPVSGTEETLFRTVIELNDTHKWTRDAIADWIEELNEVPVFVVHEEPSESIVIKEHSID